MRTRFFIVIIIVAALMAASSVATPSALRAADEKVSSSANDYETRKNESRELAKGGWQAFYSGKTSLAMTRFMRALLRDNKNAEAHWGLGLVFLTTQPDKGGSPKMEKEGIASLEKAYELAPDNGKLIVDLAQAYALQGRGYLLKENDADDALLRKSDALFVKASKLEPGYGLLYANWAVARYYHRDCKGAWEKVQRARDIGAERKLDPAFLAALREKMADPYGK